MKTQEKISVYEREVLIIKSHVNRYFKSKGMRVNSLTPRAVNDALIEILDRAIIRSKLDRKKTVFPKHV
jgi:hypothetical protein